MKKWLKNQKGLTLVELLAVIVILGIIAAIAVPAIGNIIENSRKDAQIANAEALYDATRLAQAGENIASENAVYYVQIDDDYDDDDPDPSEGTDHEFINLTEKNYIEEAFISSNPHNDAYTHAYVTVVENQYFITLSDGNAYFSNDDITDIRSLGRDGFGSNLNFDSD